MLEIGVASSIILVLSTANAMAAGTSPTSSVLLSLFGAVLVSAAGIAAVNFILKQRISAVYGPGEIKINAASYRIGAVTALFALFGVTIAFVSAFGAASGANSEFLKLLGLNVLAAAAAGSAGAFAGFVFGIPRTLDPAARAVVADVASSGGAADKTNAILASNTNLERISDWLTTLLVGATLVQLGPIITHIHDFADYLASDDGRQQGPIILLLIYFFILGFLGIYLITRLYLTSALTQTLGMLRGDGGLSNLATLKAAVAKFHAAPNEAIPGYVSLVDNWVLTDEERKDPELNSIAAYLVYRYLGLGQRQDAAQRATELHSLVRLAAAKPELKEQLKTFFSSEVSQLGDQSLAGDIIRFSLN